MADSKNRLSTLRRVAGSSSVEYKRAVDAVSGAIIQCAIAHFNLTRNDEPGLPLYQYAVSLAVSTETRKYANENLESCKDWIENKAYYLCHFCGKNPPEKESSIAKTMYVTTSRNVFLNRTRVEYSYGDVLIPRCVSCKSLHDAQSLHKTKFYFSIFGGVAAGSIGGILIYPHFKNLLLGFGWVLPFGGWTFVVLTLTLITAICGLLAHFLISRVDTSEIRNEHEIYAYPEIAKRLSQGWTFTQPSA